MLVKVHILELQDCGTDVRVKAQGRMEGAAQWRGYDAWEFRVPDYIGRNYRIGQTLKITVKPQ